MALPTLRQIASRLIALVIPPIPEKNEEGYTLVVIRHRGSGTKPDAHVSYVEKSEEHLLDKVENLLIDSEVPTEGYFQVTLPVGTVLIQEVAHEPGKFHNEYYLVRKEIVVLVYPEIRSGRRRVLIWFHPIGDREIYRIANGRAPRG